MFDRKDGASEGLMNDIFGSSDEDEIDDFEVCGRPILYYGHTIISLN